MEIQSHDPINRREVQHEIDEINKQIFEIREILRDMYFNVLADHPVFGEMQAQRRAMEWSFSNGPKNDIARFRKEDRNRETKFFPELVSSEEMYRQSGMGNSKITDLEKQLSELLDRKKSLEDILNNDVDYILRHAWQMIREIVSVLEYFKNEPNPRLPNSSVTFTLDEIKNIKTNLEAALEEYKAMVGYEQQ